MKKVAFIILLEFLLIISCSKENNTENAQLPEVELIKVLYTNYENGNVSGKEVIEYNNNKIRKWTVYNLIDEITRTEIYIYNTADYLSKIEHYSKNGDLESELNIYYNTSNQIIKTTNSEESGEYLTTTEFIYNDDNTITSNRDMNGYKATKNFKIDDNGLINQEIVDGDTRTSVEFDNLKPISQTLFSNTEIYTYLENKKLPFPLPLGDISRNNTVLLLNDLADATELATIDIITKIKSDTFTIEYAYTFNLENSPLTGKRYYNGELTNEYWYLYE